MPYNNNRKPLTKEEKTKLIEKYLTGGYHYTQLAKEYGLKNVSAWAILKREGVLKKFDFSNLNRKYTLDQSYFDIINTEEKAYFLGFLYADGYNCEFNRTVNLSLQEPDREILEKFKIAIKSNKPLQFIDIHSKNPKSMNSIRLCLSSSKLSKRLKELGCPQKKSLILEFPNENQVPKSLIKHFIRGYFDGDGTIYVGYTTPFLRPKFSVSFVGTRNFCFKLQETVQNFGFQLSLCHAGKGTHEVIFRAGMRGKRIFKFLDWFYQDATIYLDRKHTKYRHEKFLFENDYFLKTPVNKEVKIQEL